MASTPTQLTPWILKSDTTIHKCADLWLFRPPVSQGQDEVYRNLGSGSTIVLPILPCPVLRFDFDVSVMTLSPVVATPGAQYSELSWPLLAAQGFTLHEKHHDHEHDATWRHLRPENALRRRRGAPRRVSVIRHRNLPGVDLLWTGIDRRVSPHTFVHFTAGEMVDLGMWRRGVEMGVVGRSADVDDTDMEDMNGDSLHESGPDCRVTAAWIPSSSEEEDRLFETIVQGGVRVDSLP